MANNIWVNESPITCVEGDEPAFTITLSGVTTASNPSTKIYKNGQDTTSTNIPTGSASASGNVITLPVIKNLIGGSIYVVSTKVTLDGVVGTKKIMLIVQKPGEEQ